MGKKVVTSIGEAGIKESDRLVDTRATDDETAQQQREAASAMDVDLTAESAGDETAETPSVAEEAEGIEEELQADGQPSEGEGVEPAATDKEDAGEPAGEAGEPGEEETVEEKPTVEAPVVAPEAAPEEALNDKLTQSQSEAVRLHSLLVSWGIDPRTGVQTRQPTTPQETPTAVPAAAALPGYPAGDPVAMQQLMVGFLQQHQNVLGAEAVSDYVTFIRTGSDYFLYKNPKLVKLAEAVEVLNERIPFSERVRLGYEHAFGAETAALRTRQVKAQADLAAPRSMEAPSVMRPHSGGGKPKYTSGQLKVAQQMGVELP